LQQPKHEIPVFFRPVSYNDYNTIKNMYRTGSSYEYRITALRNRFSDSRNHYKNKKISLIRLIPPRIKNERITTIWISPFLYNTINPDIFNLKLKEKIECMNTKKTVIYTPKLIAFPDDNGEEDLQFITVNKNENVKEFKTRNPSYIEKENVMFNFKSNMFVENQIRSASKGNNKITQNQCYNIEEDISQSELYQKATKKFENEFLIISDDIDEYFRKEREYELKSNEECNNEDD